MTDLHSLPIALHLSERIRRRLGVTYTPEWIVSGMLNWAKSHGLPSRIIDVGAGTGRFTFAAAAAFPSAEIIAIEIERKTASNLRTAVASSPYSRRLFGHVWRRFRLRPLGSWESLGIVIQSGGIGRHDVTGTTRENDPRQ